MSASELTEKEAETITLVHQGYQTKEIARILKIAPSTVNQRVDGARKKLGAANRIQAARMFASGRELPERLICDPLPLPSTHDSAPSTATPHDNLRLQDAMFDERAVWDRGSVWRWPDFAPRDLGKAGRTLVIFALAVLMLLTAGQLLEVASGLGLMFPT